MATADLLRKLYPHAMSPFIANAPMYGSADAGLAAAVTRAGVMVCDFSLLLEGFLWIECVQLF